MKTLHGKIGKGPDWRLKWVNCLGTAPRREKVMIDIESQCTGGQGLLKWRRSRKRGPDERVMQ
jgi:hypothetical protein